MVLTRTPFRISLGGGGTDLPSYYRRWGGFVLSAAVNRYMYILVNKRFDKAIRISYSKTEIVDEVDRIAHPIVRESLRLLGITSGIEIVSVADLPGESGLGSSGSFTVGLLNALHAYRGERTSSQTVAEEAFTVEAELLKEPVGKQDQYIAAFGGVLRIEIGKDGVVNATRLQLDECTVLRLDANCLFFFTGIHRSAGAILKGQQTSIQRSEDVVLESMHKIKEIGIECATKLQAGDVDWFGASLDIHWELKKRISDRMTDDRIDRWYSMSKSNGALGGKIIGAGGGGILMFYCPDEECRIKVRNSMQAEGLTEINLRIEREGSRILLDLP